MYRNSKRTVIFPLLLAAGVVLGLLMGQFMGRNSVEARLKGVLSHMAFPNNKLTYTLSLIENQYVDSISMDSLAEHVIPLLVRELDPHSVYIPASEMQALNEPLEGEFDGIGVVFNMATDTVIVLNVIGPGTVSSKSATRSSPDAASRSTRWSACCAGRAARRCGWGWAGRVFRSWSMSRSCVT